MLVLLPVRTPSMLSLLCQWETGVPRSDDFYVEPVFELYRITSGFQDLLQLSCFERPDLAELSD